MKNGAGGPKITVIIPTRERADVFASALRTVTAQDYADLEILVSDNFSGDATASIAQNTGDPRVKYINTGKRLSMTHNWEFAISHAAGDWITIIGDDDGLLPNALNEAAALIRTTGASAIQSATCRYRWPGHKNRRYGRMRIPMRTGYEIRDSKAWMSKVLSGRAGHTDLPILYTGGFVGAAVLAEIKRVSGAVYKSRIPDVYSAFAIASVTPSYIYSHVPLGISGISRHSTGTDQLSIKTRSSESPSRKFLLEENIPFHADVPLTETGEIPPSLQAIILESYLQTVSLRAGEPVRPLDRQLEIILARSRRVDERLASWALSFARMHKIDYEVALSNARRMRLRFRLADISANILRRSGRKTIGAPRLPIENVYEASLAAAEILNAGRGGR